MALLADLHLGHLYRRYSNDPRREDSFRNAEEAMRLAAENADIIIVAGDVFDTPRISTDVLLRALDIFDIPRLKQSSVRVVGGKKANFEGIPVVAVRGNHDVGGDLSIHPVLLLERAHRLIHLHAEQIVFEKDGERVAITGVGWIPDRNAELVRRFFASRVPPPVPDAFNILVFHQPIEGIGRYPNEEPLPISVLPPGFDVYVTGHLHWHVEKRVGGYWVVIPGSTVRTQLTDREVLDDRSFWILDTGSRELEEVILPSARKGYLLRVTVSNKDVSSVLDEVQRGLGDILSKHQGIPPVIKVVLEGESSDVLDLSPLLSDYEGRAVIKVFDRTSSAVAEAISRAVEQSNQSSEVFSREFILQVLETALSASGITPGKDFREFYSLLASAGKLRTAEQRDAFLKEVERFLNEKEPFGDAPHETSSAQDNGQRLPKGTILDWTTP